jgi:hypothetical protein
MYCICLTSLDELGGIEGERENIKVYTLLILSAMKAKMKNQTRR